MNLRSLTNEKRSEVKFVKIKEIAGPRMLVLESNNTDANVCWFDTTNRYCTAKFAWDVLETDQRLNDPSDPLKDIPGQLNKELITRHVQNGALIHAIKYVRETTGWGLKESKEYVEAYRDTVLRRNPITGTYEARN